MKKNKQKKILKEKRGITLIALVVTIIALLILAGVALNLTIGENGIITRAQNARLTNELSTYKEELEMYLVGKELENNGFLRDTLTAGKTKLSYNTKQESEEGNIKTVINSISDEYLEKLEVIKGKLLINTKDKNEIKIAQSLGIEVNPYDITEEGELLSSYGNLLLMSEDGTLTIPERVTKIGEGAFSNLEGLKTIIIPGTCKEIGKNAFSHNTTLETVIMEDGVERIDGRAFYKCTNLTVVKMEDSVIYIGNETFIDCKNLTDIKLSENLEVLPNYIFQSCNKLENINVPEKCTEIGDYAFSNCSKLNNIYISKKIKKIGISAFSNCSNLTNMTIDPTNDYYKIENGILMTKNGEKIVNINANSMVSGKLYIPEGTKEILTGALSLCKEIESINIPSTMDNITGLLFSGMSRLTNIIINENNPNYFSENNCIYTTNYNDLVYYPISQETIIINNVKNIKSYAINDSGKNKIKNIIISGEVESIENRAIVFCKDFNVSIGEGVTDINPLFIYFESNLLNLEIDESNPTYKSENKYIYSKDGKTIIRYYGYDKEIEIMEGIENIGIEAFYYKQLTKVILPLSLKNIGENAFGYDLLTDIEIPKNVEMIGSSAFNSCSSIDKIKINKPEGSILGAPWGAPKGAKVVEWVGE